MLRVMQPLMRSASDSTMLLNIAGYDAKVETSGAANGLRPAFMWQLVQARSLPAKRLAGSVALLPIKRGVSTTSCQP